MLARRDDLGGVDRNILKATRGTQNDRLVRTSDARQPQSHRAFDDLRLRRTQVRNSLREWRAEPDSRYPGADVTRRQKQARDLRQGFQNGSDADEDDHRARAKG